MQHHADAPVSSKTCMNGADTEYESRSPAPAPSPSSSEASLSDDPLSSAPPAFLGVLGGNRRPGGGLKKKVDYGNFGSTLVNTGVGEYDSDEFED